MTRKKTESFDTTSPLKLSDKESRGVDQRSNLQADWARYITLFPRINGKPIADYLSDYNNFDSEQDVKQFFKGVLLADVQLETGEDEAIQFLLTYFRQKGFMQPVTVTLERALLVESKETPYEYQLSSNYLEQQIDIRTTDNGFTIQELAIVTKLNKTERTSGNVERLEPTNEMPFITKAEGTLDFNFKDNPGAPKITVKSNFISYGHPEIKSLMHKRNFLQRIFDFIAQILGMKPQTHTVELNDYSERDEDTPRANNTIGQRR